MERDGADHIAETTDEGSGYRTVHDRGDDERHEAEADADVPCAEGTESCQNDLESDKNGKGYDGFCSEFLHKNTSFAAPDYKEG